jgi:hypothetical protein
MSAGTAGTSRALSGTAALLLAASLLGGCSTIPGEAGIGRPPGPLGARSFVTPAGVRAPVEESRIWPVYDQVLDQFETISCVRWVTDRESTRSRAPRPPRTGLRTTADSWNEWFEGHDHVASRRRFCLYGGAMLGVSAGLSASRGLQDSTLHVVTVRRREAGYPWESLVIQGDTARIGTHVDAHTAHSIYAFHHLLLHQGRLEPWLPEAARANDEFEIEKAILAQTAEAWMLMRGGYGADPDVHLDELFVAREQGLLDALIFTRRPEAFPERRARWLAENPDGPEAYLAWFRETFDVRDGQGP